MKGGEVAIYYDPMIAKVIAHARTFEQATAHSGREYSDGFHPADAVHDDPALLIVVAAAIHRRYMDRAAQISGQTPGWCRCPKRSLRTRRNISFRQRRGCCRT